MFNPVKGLKTENLFKEVVARGGYKVTPSTLREDMKDHIDFYISNKRGRWSVDVKSHKCIEPNIPSKEYTIAELKNVNGDHGWLYGKAEYIAFEYYDTFYFVSRLALLSLVENVEDTFTSTVKEAYNKKYRRSGTQEEVTLIKMADVINLSEFKLKIK